MQSFLHWVNVRPILKTSKIDQYPNTGSLNNFNVHTEYLLRYLDISTSSIPALEFKRVLYSLKHKNPASFIRYVLITKFRNLERTCPTMRANLLHQGADPPLLL